MTQPNTPAPPPEERAPSDETLDAEWVEFDRLRARVHVLDEQIAQLDRERLQITRRLERMLVHIPPRVNYE